MTVTVRELIDSRPVEFVGGKNLAYRMFSVEQDSPALSSPDEVAALMGSNGLPKVGDPFPGTTLEAFDYRIRKFDGQTDLFHVAFTYRDPSGIGAAIGKQPGEVGYVEISFDARADFQDNWRTLTREQFDGLVASGGPYPSGSNSADFDIGGSPVDAAGEPVSVLRRSVVLVVGVTLDHKPRIGDYFPFIGRRNNTEFGGAPVGSVLYAPPRGRRVDVNRWNVEHQFVVDDWYHMLQQAARNPRGEVILDAESGRASNVWFSQPFPSFGNFYAIDTNFAGEL
jgi:hypothetical protein